MEKDKGPNPRATEVHSKAESLRSFTREVMRAFERRFYDPKCYTFDTSNDWVKESRRRGWDLGKVLAPAWEDNGNVLSISLDWPSDDMAMEQTIHYVPDDSRKEAVEGLVCHNWLILPMVAVRQRQKDLAQMLAYAQETGGVGALRMLVVTSGEPCHAENIPARDAWMKERIQTLRRRAWFSEVAELCWSVLEVPFSADPDSEPEKLGVTVGEARRDAGGFLYHAHRHVVFRLIHPLGKARWRDFLAKLQAHFEGRWIRESGEIKQIEHACKYTVKLPDLKLLVENEDELIRLHEALLRVRRLESYESFRKFRGYLGQSGDHVRRVQMLINGHYVSKWVLVAALARVKRREGPEGLMVNRYCGRTVRTTKKGLRRVHNIVINAIDPPEFILDQIYELPQWDYALTPSDAIPEKVNVPRRLFRPSLSSTNASLIGVWVSNAKNIWRKMVTVVSSTARRLGFVRALLIAMLLYLILDG